MKLSLWIFADWLKAYKPQLNIREGGLEIETVRLFSSELPVADNVLYVGRLRDWFIHGDNSVICAHKNDIILLPTEDIDEILNQILNAFEFYQSWNTRMLEAISSDLSPAEILSIADPVIDEPIYLLNSAQYSIALSEKYGRGQVNRQWDSLLDNGSSEIEFLTRINKARPDHLSVRGLYCFEVDFVPQRSYNYNMFLEDTWIGLCSMIERNREMPRHKQDLFQIFCQNMELWYLSHSREQEAFVIESLFRDALVRNQPASDSFLRRCRLYYSNPDASYYLVSLTAQSAQTMLMTHVCKEINRLIPDSLAIVYQDAICVLINDAKGQGDACLAPLVPLLKRNGYYGGYSLPFQGPDDLHQHLREASYTTRQIAGTFAPASSPAAGGPAEPKKADPGMRLFSFRDYALEYALEELSQTARSSLIHPAATALIRYDQAHRTAFARTLYVYLKKERSQSRTAAALNLHRNSLTYRLARIRDLLAADLDDDRTRMHLLLSLTLLASEIGTEY